MPIRTTYKTDCDAPEPLPDPAIMDSVLAKLHEFCRDTNPFDSCPKMFNLKDKDQTSAPRHVAALAAARLTDCCFQPSADLLPVFVLADQLADSAEARLLKPCCRKFILQRSNSCSMACDLVMQKLGKNRERSVCLVSISFKCVWPAVSESVACSIALTPCEKVVPWAGPS